MRRRETCGEALGALRFNGVGASAFEFSVGQFSAFIDHASM